MTRLSEQGTGRSCWLKAPCSAVPCVCVLALECQNLHSTCNVRSYLGREEILALKGPFEGWDLVLSLRSHLGVCSGSGLGVTRDGYGAQECVASMNVLTKIEVKGCVYVCMYILTHSHVCAETQKKGNNMVNLPVMICLSLLGFYCFSLFKGATVWLRHRPTAVAAVSQLTGNFPLQGLGYAVAQQRFKQTVAQRCFLWEQTPNLIIIYVII